MGTPLKQFIFDQMSDALKGRNLVPISDIFSVSGNAKADFSADQILLYYVEGDRAVFVSKPWADLYDTQDEVLKDLRTMWAPYGAYISINADEVDQQLIQLAEMEQGETAEIIMAYVAGDYTVLDPLVRPFMRRSVVRAVLDASGNWEDDSDWWDMDTMMARQSAATLPAAPSRPKDMF